MGCHKPEMNVYGLEAGVQIPVRVLGVLFYDLVALRARALIFIKVNQERWSSNTLFILEPDIILAFFLRRRKTKKTLINFKNSFFTSPSWGLGRYTEHQQQHSKQGNHVKFT